MRAPAPEARLAFLRIGSAAFAAALPLYVGIAYLMLADADAEARLGDAPALLPELLALLGVVVILMAPLSRNLFWRQTSTMQRDDVSAQVSRFFKGTVIASAVRQAGALLGFVVTGLTADIVWVASLASLALVAMLLDWPSDARFARYRSDSR